MHACMHDLAFGKIRFFLSLYFLLFFAVFGTLGLQRFLGAVIMMGTFEVDLTLYEEVMLTFGRSK